jgi:hypothetical protein
MKLMITSNDPAIEAMFKMAIMAIEALKPENDMEVKWDAKQARRRSADATEEEQTPKPRGGARVHYMIIAPQDAEGRAKIVAENLAAFGTGSIKGRIYGWIANQNEAGIQVTKRMVKEKFEIAASTAERELGELKRAGIIDALEIDFNAAS